MRFFFNISKTGKFAEEWYKITIEEGVLPSLWSTTPNDFFNKIKTVFKNQKVFKKTPKRYKCVRGNDAYEEFRMNLGAKFYNECFLKYNYQKNDISIIRS